MFNLEQSLTVWREQMLAAGIASPVPLEELEAHLREEIGRLMKSGLDEQPAFEAAVQKIGPGPAIRNEFKKVAAPSPGRHWRQFEIMFLAAALLYPLFAGVLVLVVKNGSFSEMSPGQQLSSLAAAVVFSLLACGIRLGGAGFPVIQTNRIRNVLFVPVLLWLVAFACLIMPHADLTVSQRGVASLWGFAPFGVLVGWLWGMATALRKKLATMVSAA